MERNSEYDIDSIWASLQEEKENDIKRHNEMSAEEIKAIEGNNFFQRLQEEAL